MWIFLPDAFVSVVAHRDKPDVMLVRGRLPGDVERFLACGDYVGAVDAKVHETPTADYRFRAEVSTYIFGLCLAAAAKEIRYTNFKGEAERIGDGSGRVAMLHRVWTVTRLEQLAAMRDAEADGWLKEVRGDFAEFADDVAGGDE